MLKSIHNKKLNTKRKSHKQYDYKRKRKRNEERRKGNKHTSVDQPTHRSIFRPNHASFIMQCLHK